MPSTYAGHYTDPPRDGTGKPIPHASFQLYLPGTKTSPTFYTDRAKTQVAVGDPTSDAYGNVDVWVEPGHYEYWYGGRFVQTVTVSEDNGEDDVALAAQVASLQNAIANVSVTGQQYAPGGTSDDTTALQNYIDSLPANSECHFAPGRTYIVSTPIKYRDDAAYIGHGHSHGDSASVIRQKTGANITSGSTNTVSGLFVPSSWHNNSATCAHPVKFENLCFDVNVANNPGTTAAGLLTMNFWTWIKNNVFKNGGNKGYGLYLADKTRNDVSITNSCSEAHIYENRFENCKGFFAQCTDEIANLDGVLFENKFAEIYGTAILVQRAAGWAIELNHIYGGSGFGNAIDLGNCFATQVIGNYIEDFGALGASGQWYNGISATCLNDWGTRIIGNHIASPEVAGSYQEYITVRAGSGQTTASAVVEGNTLFGKGGANATGIVLANDSGGTLRYVRKNNNLYGFAGGKFVYVDVACIAAGDY